MADAIRAEQLTKTFGPKVAVDRMDMSVPEGGLYGFIGPNGAGKTTTIRMIMSIIFPDAGRLSVLGKSSALKSKDEIGYLPEERGVYRKMRVSAFLKYIGRLKGVGAHDLKSRVGEWLERVGLPDVADKRCEELSKGMQQKVQFISSVLHRPRLIILDEPFSGLDPVNMRLMRDLFLEQHREGRTIIFSTHVMHQAEALCDHIVMIDRGRKVLDATMDQIRSRFDPKAIVVEPADGGSDAGARLASVPGVMQVERDGPGYLLRLDHETDAADAMTAVIGAMPVMRLERKRPTLEDVFIEIVGHSVHEAEHAGAAASAVPEEAPA